MLSRVGVLVVVSLTSACVTPPSATAPSACRVGDALVETQLFFGLSRPNGGVVSTRAFDAFVAHEVAPRFPEGFTVIDGAGFWRDEASRRTISEKSKVVVRLHHGAAETDAAIGAIVAAYKSAFQQDAVLRVDRPVCAQF